MRKKIDAKKSLTPHIYHFLSLTPLIFKIYHLHPLIHQTLSLYPLTKNNRPIYGWKMVRSGKQVKYTLHFVEAKFPPLLLYISVHQTRRNLGSPSPFPFSLSPPFSQPFSPFSSSIYQTKRSKTQINSKPNLFNNHKASSIQSTALAVEV